MAVADHGHIRQGSRLAGFRETMLIAASLLEAREMTIRIRREGFGLSNLELAIEWLAMPFG